MRLLDFIDIYELNNNQNVNNLENIKKIDKTKYINSVIDTELHYITDINIKLRKQYIFLITYINLNYCKIHLLKKKYNEQTKLYEVNKIKLIGSYLIDKLATHSQSMEWKNNIFYPLNELRYFYNLDFSKVMHINTQGLLIPHDLFSNYLESHLIRLPDFDYIKYFFRINPKSYLLSQILIENIYSTYGLKINELNKIRCKYFKRKEIRTILSPYSYEERYKNYTLINSNLLINCDLCNKELSGNNIYSWHNPLYGDLCDICFENRRLNEMRKRQLIINKIKLIGKTILFKIELKKTKELLKNINLEKYNNNNYEILKKIFINYKKSKELDNICCNICLDDLFKSNVLSGGCGHCFHEFCIANLDKDNYDRIKCPTCRLNTEFVKLFF